MNLRLRYLPLAEVTPEMQLGAPVLLRHGDVLRFSLPAGHALTEDNLRQLTAHRAEYVCVALPDSRSDEEKAEEEARAVARVEKIFSTANLEHAPVRALFDAVLAFRRL